MKPKPISISKLARYASDPSGVFDKVNVAATQYGNRAHNAVGRGPSLIGYVIVGLIALALAKMAGFF